MTQQYCVFCDIIAGVEPATVRYEDDEVIVFDNVLGWTRLMLLAVPKHHVTQTELWSHLGAVGRVAVEQGRKYAPEGFRILSNFGPFGMQSQSHGHLHILDHTEATLEIAADPPQSTVARIVDHGAELLRTDVAVYYDAGPLVPRAAPITACALPAAAAPSQDELWQDVHLLGEDVAGVGWSSSPNGFRLLANFPNPDRTGYQERGHIHLLGGTFLGHYA